MVEKARIAEHSPSDAANQMGETCTRRFFAIQPADAAAKTSPVVERNEEAADRLKGTVPFSAFRLRRVAGAWEAPVDGGWRCPCPKRGRSPSVILAGQIAQNRVAGHGQKSQSLRWGHTAIP